MDWVHCNKCFVQRKDQPLYCTTCCHIFCYSCMTKPCSLCGKNFKATEIGNNMPFTLNYFFDDIIKTTQRFQKTIKFQWEHRTSIEAQKMKVFDEIAKLKQIKAQQEKTALALIDNIKKEQQKIRKMQAFFDYCRRKNAENRSSSNSSYLIRQSQQSNRKSLLHKTPMRGMGSANSDPFKMRLQCSQRKLEEKNSDGASSITWGNNSSVRRSRNINDFIPHQKQSKRDYLPQTEKNDSVETGYESFPQKQTKTQGSGKYLDSFKFGSLF